MLEIRELGIGYRPTSNRGRTGVRWTLDRVTLTAPLGSALGVVGEAGSGKSTLAAALAGMLPAEAALNGGTIRLGGVDLTRMPPAMRRSAHKLRVAWIPADSCAALPPLSTVAGYLREAAGIAGSDQGWRDRALGVLGALGMTEAARVLEARCFRLSPQLAQTVLLAGAVVQGAAAILLDEPIVPLSDREAFFARLAELRRPTQTMLVVFSRDPALAAGGADRLAVLYGGRVVEQGPAAAVLGEARHPYSQGFLAGRPAWPPVPDRQLAELPGLPPVPGEIIAGCRFGPRCPAVRDACRAGEPATFAVGRGHDVACLLAKASQ